MQLLPNFQADGRKREPKLCELGGAALPRNLEATLSFVRQMKIGLGRQLGTGMVDCRDSPGTGVREHVV